MKTFKQYITEAKSEQIIVYRLGSKQDNLFGKTQPILKVLSNS